MPEFELLDSSGYHHRLAQTAGAAVVCFSSPDCGTCRTVERLLPAALPEGTHLFKIDAQRDTALARAFEIFHLPTLLLYRDGRFHAWLEAEVTPAAMRHALVQALARPAQEEP